MELRTLRYFAAVVEELHFGRAAERLHMTQPPLSRAIKALENELGVVLLERSPAGVTPTAAGTALYEEAREIAERVELARARVAAAAGSATITVGSLADSVEQTGVHLAEAYRRRHPGVAVRIRETDFTDPTAGLAAGLVDVALTRAPFTTTGISTRVLRSDPVGVILRSDDPLAGCESLGFAELADRRWFRFPEGTDPVWRAYWTGAPDDVRRRGGPVVRTAGECLRSVLWNGTVGLAPLGHALPDGLTAVRLTDLPASDLVIAWRSADRSSLVEAFVRIAVALHRREDVGG
ncbi:LysR family transcriptional regulator [Phytomonospora sp. NPDC050363]|uniref:LysR substrate-binding domain-containing protein n=1 Tax=Phytomonospora sp. NPDC050363 TaxID=3155642 RepID=UPI0033D65300